MLCLGAGVLASTAVSAKPSWDRVAHIKLVSEQLAEMQKARGALGTFRLISACYQTFGVGSAYSQGFVGCLVQDYIHSNVTAAIYSRLPPETLQKMNAPSPEVLLQSMSSRLSAGFAQYKIDEKEAQELVGLIEKHGLASFGKARFPDAPAEPKR